MTRYCTVASLIAVRRWPELLARAVDDPSHVVPGATSAVVLSRGQANNLDSITFEAKVSVEGD